MWNPFTPSDTQEILISYKKNSATVVMQTKQLVLSRIKNFCRSQLRTE